MLPIELIRPVLLWAPRLSAVLLEIVVDQEATTEATAILNYEFLS